MQRALYDGLYRASRSSIIYNGIPLADIDDYIKKETKSGVRKSLGYDDSDFLVLHLGTVCKRKAQLSSVQALSLMKKKHPELKAAKLLMVGARCTSILL